MCPYLRMLLMPSDGQLMLMDPGLEPFGHFSDITTVAVLVFNPVNHRLSFFFRQWLLGAHHLGPKGLIWLVCHIDIM